MVMTVRQLAARTGLGLSIAAGEAGAHRTVSWAHAIELRDPTPWLSGGELVMTTGIALPRDDEGQRQYLSRLADFGAAALAIDTNTIVPPPAIIEAADERGFTVLRVAAETPFIAVSRAVIDDLSADRLRTVKRVVDGQERLARAAARGGSASLVEALSRRIDAAVCLVDRVGDVVAQCGECADVRRRLVDRLAAEGGRISGGRALVDADMALTIDPLPVTGEPHNYLAVASSRPLDSEGRLLVGHAVSLFSLEFTQRSGLLDADLRLRAAALALLRSGGTLDRRLALRLGFKEDSEVSAMFATSSSLTARQVTTVVARDIGHIVGAYLAEELDSGVALVVPAHSVEEVAKAILAGMTREFGAAISVGVSRTVRMQAVEHAVRQARAAASSRVDGGCVSIDEVGTLALLLGNTPEVREALVMTSGVSLLLEHDAAHGSDLVPTLRAYLQHGGRADVSAASLCIHRHTMRNRMRRIAEVCRRDVDDAQVRTDLWLALQVLALTPQPGRAEP